MSPPRRFLLAMSFELPKSACNQKANSGCHSEVTVGVTRGAGFHRLQHPLPVCSRSPPCSVAGEPIARKNIEKLKYLITQPSSFVACAAPLSCFRYNLSRFLFPNTISTNINKPIMSLLGALVETGEKSTKQFPALNFFLVNGF